LRPIRILLYMSKRKHQNFHPILLYPHILI
jgi:hypothetical protein